MKKGPTFGHQSIGESTLFQSFRKLGPFSLKYRTRAEGQSALSWSGVFLHVRLCCRFSYFRLPSSHLTGSKYATSSTRFVFSIQIGKQRLPFRLVIDWDTFNFFSAKLNGIWWNLQEARTLYTTSSEKFDFRLDGKRKPLRAASGNQQRWHVVLRWQYKALVASCMYNYLYLGFCCFLLFGRGGRTVRPHVCTFLHVQMESNWAELSVCNCRHTGKWCGTIKAVGNTDHTRQSWIHMQTPLYSLSPDAVRWVKGRVARP